MKQFKNKIFLGDCIKLMRELPDASVATCITDPPYNYELIDRNWNTPEIKRRTERIGKGKGKTTLIKNIPYGSGLAGGVRNARWYAKNRANIVDYQKWIEDWGREAFRVLKPGSFILVFNSTRTAAHVQVGLENVGFYARDIIVWRRNSGIPRGANLQQQMKKKKNKNADKWDGWHSCLRNEWEAIVVLQKPIEGNYANNAAVHGVGALLAETPGADGFQGNIFEEYKKAPEDKVDFLATVKPLGLMEKLVRLTTPSSESNVVLDPFMGSGTTAIAATRAGCIYVGYEQDEGYHAAALKRVERLCGTQTPPTLPGTGKKPLF